VYEGVANAADGILEILISPSHKAVAELSAWGRKTHV
jgi:hypothetical protein